MAPSPDGPPSSIEVEINVDANIDRAINHRAISAAVIAAADSRGFRAGQIGVRVTDDPTIRQINDKHLGHDYATDVISFGYSADLPVIEGELIVSIDTAIERARELAWPTEHELLLYVVHGTLHICGMDDHDNADRAAMRRAEADVMTRLGIDEIHRCGADMDASTRTESRS
ncbi:Endoribonuclease YbeY [Rubripirellula tenax]|uniref:Endoribonuclease YbeY n=2 Tax=Rubripirellula tenax TaxID=2528015 RepID=A0A5C6FG43_9BACT|nr:Endoribonuclease YbeY [Rubripirellula tenax]